MTCGELVAISPDGRHLRQIAISGEGRRVGAYTRRGEEGRQLVLRGGCDDPAERESFCVVDVDTEEARSHALSEDAQLVSLDGDHAAFQDRVRGARRLFVIELRSGEQRSILPTPEGRALARQSGGLGAPACPAGDHGGVVVPVELEATEWSDDAELFHSGPRAALHLTAGTSACGGCGAMGCGRRSGGAHRG